MDISVISCLGIMHKEAVCESLGGCYSSFWVIVLLWGHMMSVCLTLQETAKLFSKEVLPFCTHTKNI